MNIPDATLLTDGGAPPAGGAIDRVQALLEQAKTIGRTDPPAGLACAEGAAALAVELGDSLGEARAVVNGARWHYRLGNHEQAMRAAVTGRRLAATLGDQEAAGMGLNVLGLVDLDRSRFAEAAHHFLEAVELLRGSPDESDPVFNLGFIYQRLGDHAMALEHFLVSYRLDEARHSPDRAMTLAAIGECYLNMGDAERALAYLDDAQAAALSSNDPRVELDVALQLGRALRRERQFGRARHHLTVALALAEGLADLAYELEVLQALTELAEEEHDFAAGEESATRTLAVAGRLGDRYGEARGLIGLARARLGTMASPPRPVAEVLAPLHEARAIAEDLGVLPLTGDVEAALAVAYETLGDFRQALAHYKAFHAAERAILHEEGLQRARLLAVRFETERAQNEAEDHRRYSAELAAANEALRAAHAETTRLLAQVQEQARLLQRETTEDPLTGLRNRRYLDRVLTTEWVSAHESGGELAVVVVDIDHFKEINDRCTHTVGDEVLRRLAELLTASVRPVDHVARIGGEEFVLVLPGSNAAEAARIAERVRATVESADWRAIHPDLGVTVSVGVSTAREHAGPDRVLATADAHLYKAKRAGRNRVWQGTAELPALVIHAE